MSVPRGPLLVNLPDGQGECDVDILTGDGTSIGAARLGRYAEPTPLPGTITASTEFWIDSPVFPYDVSVTINSVDIPAPNSRVVSFPARVDPQVRTSVGSAASGSPWVEHDVSVALADINQDGAGTWTDGAALSQTDPLGDSTIWTKTAYPSTSFIIEAEVKLASGQNGAVTAGLAVTAGATSLVGVHSSINVGDGFNVVRTAVGDTGDIALATWVDGSANSGPFVLGILADQWNTVRAVVAGPRQSIYLNGVYAFSNEEGTGGNAAAQGGGFGSDPDTGTGGEDFSTDKVALSAIGLVSFRNVKVWTQALPA